MIKVFAARVLQVTVGRNARSAPFDSSRESPYHYWKLQLSGRRRGRRRDRGPALQNPKVRIPRRPGRGEGVTLRRKTTINPLRFVPREPRILCPGSRRPHHSGVSSTYDTLGRKTSSSDPDLGTWSYVYDGFGELAKQTDALGQVTTLVYDALGRVVERDEPGMVSEWAFGTSAPAIGKLVSACVAAAPGGACSGRILYQSNSHKLRPQADVDDCGR